MATTGQSVNVPDVYSHEDEFDFSGVQRYDQSTGYKSKSMLVMPLAMPESGVIGVLQLINAIDTTTGEPASFAPETVSLTQSFASLAAAAITNARQIHQLEHQFEMFTRTIALAIDEKSPTTSGHVRRVAEITQLLAQAVHADTVEFGDTCFDRDEMREIRIAAWLHDIGKITTPQHILDKRTKLESIYDRYHTIETRYALIKANLRARLGATGASAETVAGALAEIDEELAFITACCRGEERMSDDKVARLEEIAQSTYDHDGSERNRLDPDELRDLSIRRGTLNDEEFQIMRNHASAGLRMLNNLPFSRKLRNVPLYAGAHHERIDGTGYPNGLAGDELPMQARILAVADVLEALTARDRPYRAPIPVDKALEILQSMADGGGLDPRLVSLIKRTNLGPQIASTRAAEVSFTD